MEIARALAPIFPGRTLVLSDYYFLSRLSSVVFGTATVYLVFLFARSLDSKIGLLSAAIFAVSPLAIMISHYATVDSMMGLWSALSLVGMLAWLRGNKRGQLLAAAAVGLAVSTKYNAAILLLPIALIAVELEWAQMATPLTRARRVAFIGIVLAGALIVSAVCLGRPLILDFITGWTARGTLQPVYIQIFDRILTLLIVLAILGIGLAIGVQRKWRWAQGIAHLCTSRTLLVPMILAVITFLCFSPFVLIDLPSFVRNFFFQLNKNISGGIVGYSPGSRSYLAILDESTPSSPLQYLQALA
jgi:4-amino-4-deoxy-L-arabinose transferase-like glycosyltransferase